MRIFILVDAWLRKKKGILIGFIGCLVGLIRYFFCLDFSCAVSYGVTAMLIASIVWAIYSTVSKEIITRYIKRASGEIISSDKYDLTELSSVDEKESE